jgi:ribosomal protein L11 methyltransferase
MPSARTPHTATSVAVLETSEQAARKVTDLAAEYFVGDDVAVSLVDSGAGRWCVTIYFRATPDRKAVRALIAGAAGPAAAKALRWQQVAAKDWVRESLAALKPVTAGRFIVHGAHDRAKIAQNRIGIEIEAALAFGTGHHGTTRGCLEALDRLCKSSSKKRRRQIDRHPEVPGEAGPRRRRPGRRGRTLRGSLRSHLRVTERALVRSILDLGTGSGVLAIAAARALRRRVLASDNDSIAVRAARANAQLNRAGALIEVVTANGVNGGTLRQHAPYDLVFANILLRPLQRFAAPLSRLTARGGRVVLSGLLRSQANAAIAAYHALVLERRIDVDGWTTLVMKKPLPPAGRGW